MATTPLIFLPLVVHLTMAGFAIYEISKSIVLSERQKQANIILALVIPFVWPVLLHYILKKEPNYFDKRKHITNDKLESGINSAPYIDANFTHYH